MASTTSKPGSDIAEITGFGLGLGNVRMELIQATQAFDQYAELQSPYLGHSIRGRFELAAADFDKTDAPWGWTRLSDAQIRDELKLDPTDFHPAGSDFRAALFRSVDGQLVLSFKGTDPKSADDWKNDLIQSFGYKSDYYSRAIQIASDVSRKTHGHFEIVGHSLGGGLAAAAAIVTGAHATTFNAAGVNEATVNHFHKSLDDATKTIAGGEHLVDDFEVKGQILDELQRHPLRVIATVEVVSPPLAAFLAAQEATGHQPRPAAGVSHYLDDPHPIGIVRNVLEFAVPTLKATDWLLHSGELHLTGAVRDALQHSSYL
jgi:hypothetical protein